MQRSILIVALGACGGLSCSAILGLDEPTHRDGSGAPGSGAGGDSSGSGGSAGTTSGSGGDSTVSAGAGGSSETGGAVGAGGAIGSGGVSGTGGAGGSGGSVDAGAGGKVADAGAEASPFSCATFPLCDDFQSTATGQPPDVNKWTIEPTAPGNGVHVEGMHFPGMRTCQVDAVGSNQSLSVFWNKVPLDIGTKWFVRMRVNMEKVSSMGAGSIALFKDPSSNFYFMLAVENGWLSYRSSANGGLRLLPSTQVGLNMGYNVPAATWFCVEMSLDTQKREVQTWVNGLEIASLRADGMPTQGIDDNWPAAPFPSKLQTIGFGWWGPQAPILTLYLDDIAVAATRIGCN